ncbi:MFS transporter [Tersicoccus sp. Bi-70]|uniref:MFS transporter n=1 Tax=Tersicoccus sp. Bi-70 TaxID=1897634 RepID=UPI001300EC98|nr:MFS transporter [Tersicoccus sp. Bi-70]
MSGYQIQAVLICLVINMLDGYDTLVIAFSGPALSKEFALSSTALGVILSAGMLGMGAGSLFLAPLADRIGRRNLTLIALFTTALFLLLTTTATDITQVGVYRVLSGLGIGAMLASLNVITAEYSSDRRRATAIAVYAVGYPVGATLGGFVAAGLITSSGWRSAFVLGAVLTAALAVVVWFRLPESIDYLTVARPRGALEKVNRLLVKMGHGTISALPEVEARPRHGAVRALFAGGKWRTTLLIWVAFFILLASFNFAAQWTPTILVSSGLSQSNGIGGGVLVTLGGIFGSLIFGLLAVKYSARWTTVAFFVLDALSFLAFALTIGQLGPVLAAAIAIGFFTNGAMAGVYALTPNEYATSERSTAMGAAIGVGRIGAIISPALAGALLDARWPQSGVYLLFILPLLIAAAAIALIPSTVARARVRQEASVV